MKQPLILVTNDDGILALGIRALVEVASEFGEVVVVAPDKPQSGQGHAITLIEPIRLRKVSPFGKDIAAYECSGTPADCVKLGNSVILKDRKIDICVSGINHGANSSINVIYSGTMSAAMEASINNIPAIGFSLLNFSSDADFEPSKAYVRQLMTYVLENGLKNTKLLNVNIPNLPAAAIQGIKFCRQCDGVWEEEYQVGKDPLGEPYYWLAGKFQNNDTGNDHDIAALAAGYVSVVPCGHDLTAYAAIEELNKNFFG
jgi:5'-nucleotidase